VPFPGAHARPFATIWAADCCKVGLARVDLRSRSHVACTPRNAAMPQRAAARELRSVFRRNIACACACWYLLVASSLAAPVVRADELDAKDLFAQARGLRLQGQCASALPLFRRAYDVYPAGLGSLRNIAECEEEVGHFAAARRAWLDLQRALSTNDQTRYEGWDQDAALAAARLALKLGTLTIEVHAVGESGKPAQATGIQVSVNGEALTPDAVGRPLYRDPGQYVVRSEGAAPGVTRQRIVDLAAGEGKQVVLDVVVPAPPDREAMPSRTTTPPTAAWIAMGVGAASLVGAVVAALERQSALGDLKAECGSTTACPPALNDPEEKSKVQGIEDRGHGAATWVNVFAIVGIIGLSSGVVLYATARSRPPRTGFLMSPGGISVVGSY
jgi:hypothetical protein